LDRDLCEANSHHVPALCSSCCPTSVPSWYTQIFSSSLGLCSTSSSAAIAAPAPSYIYGYDPEAQQAWRQGDHGPREVGRIYMPDSAQPYDSVWAKFGKDDQHEVPEIAVGMWQEMQKAPPSQGRKGQEARGGEAGGGPGVI
jgi:hypothetical protein